VVGPFPSIPVIEALDGEGKLLWRRDFAELRGYTFDDVVALRGRLMALATRQDSELGGAVLLSVEPNGSSARKLVIDVSNSGTPTKPRGFLSIFGHNLIAVINSGYSFGIDRNVKPIMVTSGLCYRGGQTKVITVEVIKEGAIAGFMV
jgi:hypothetical protein